MSMYNAACAFSLALEILIRTEEDIEADEAQRAELQRMALQSLSTAIRLGYDNFSQLAEDPELAAVRELPEFQTLLPSQPNKD